MYRAIMVPLDGSAFSEYALPVALPLARACGACVHLVHVRRDLSWLALTDESRDPERLYLGAVAARVRAAGVEARAALREDELGDVMPAGRPLRIVAEILRDYMRQNAIDLVVMTTHGRGGFKRGWLGSVTDSLVRDTHIPVLIVRPPRRHAAPDERPEHPIQRITVPLDGSRTAESALEPALELAKATGASIHLVRVVEPMAQPANPYVHWVVPSRRAVMRSQRAIAKKYLDEVTERMRAQAPSVSCEVVAGAAASAILRTVRWPKSDVIVMATHGSGGAARLFLGSVTDRVIRSSEIPVLAIQAPDMAENTQCDTVEIEADDVLAQLGVPVYRVDPWADTAS